MAGSVLESSGSWARAHLRLLIILAALLLLYALAGFLLVPRLVRNGIQSYVQKDLGRHISITALYVNPFTLTVDLRGVALSEADGAPIASFDRLFLNAELSSIFHWAWTFKEIRIDRPSINVVVNDDGSLNLARLAPPTPAGQPPPRAGSGTPAVRIGVFSVRDGSVRYEDRSRGKPFNATLRPIEFSLQDFRTAADFQNRYQFSATTLAGERLAWSGQFTVQPLGSNGQFAIDGLRAATIAAYLQDALPFDLPSGALDIHGEYRLAVGAKLGLSIQLPTLAVRDIGIAPKHSDAGPWIRVPTLAIADTNVSLGERSVTVGRIEASGADISLWREPDGQLNLSRLFAARAPAAAKVAAGSTAANAAVAADTAGDTANDWKVSVGSVQLRDATIKAEDRTTMPAVVVKLAPIAVTVDGYSSAPGSVLKIAATVGIARASFGARGSLGLEPLKADFDLDLKDFDLSLLQPYVAQNVDLTLNRGRLTAKAKLAFAATPGHGSPALSLHGDVEVADLQTQDGLSRRDFVSWESLKLSGLRFQKAPDRLSIETIVARQPYGRVTIASNGSLNVETVLKTAAPKPGIGAGAGAAAGAGASASPASPPAPAVPPLPMRIGSVRIVDGTADFTDRSVEPRFAVQMVGLNGSIVGLSSDSGSRAAVMLEGKVDRYAPVSISGKVNLLSAVAFTDLVMNFRNMELTTFNPYSGKFAGYSIEQGKLNTELHYHVENRRLEAQHHIVIDQLEFGAATDSKQAVPLPIKLAVALLKDRNGVIDINLPVTGSLDDPKFRIGPIVWKLFVGLLTKIVTAPFAMLGSLFGGGADLAFVDFAPGSAVLMPDQAQKIAQLSKALVERPQLKLDIPLRAASPDDDAALAVAGLERAIAAQLAAPATAAQGKVKPATTTGAPGASGAGAAAGVRPDLRLAALGALYLADFGTAPAYPPPGSADSDVNAAHSAWLEQQLLPKFAATPQRRDALGRNRAEAVQTAMLANTEVPPERVFLTERASGGGVPGAVHMELKLQ